MRVSWKLLDDGSLALVYQHSRRLTKERYDAFVMDGAWITADKRQERAIVESVLSINEQHAPQSYIKGEATWLNTQKEISLRRANTT